MARTKKLNIVVNFVGTGYIINDLGTEKSPRFELYHIPTKKIAKKSDDPRDFDNFIEKVWKENK